MDGKLIAWIASGVLYFDLLKKKSTYFVCLSGMENILTAENAEPDEQPSNSDRLLTHLKEDALSTRLVRTHSASGGDITTLKDVIDERLEQVRQDLVSKD